MKKKQYTKPELLTDEIHIDSVMLQANDVVGTNLTCTPNPPFDFQNIACFQGGGEQPCGS